MDTNTESQISSKNEKIFSHQLLKQKNWLLVLVTYVSQLIIFGFYTIWTFTVIYKDFCLTFFFYNF